MVNNNRDTNYNSVHAIGKESEISTLSSMPFFQVCSFGAHTFGFSDQISQQARTVRFAKVQVLEFYGSGGGLRHLSFTGPVIKGGTIYTIQS